MGFVRNQQGMELALKKLKKIEEHVDELKASNPHELMRVNEAMHMIRYCPLTIRSSMERKESGRGCYRRSDYPKVDSYWDNKEIIQWQENGEPKLVIQTMGQ